MIAILSVTVFPLLMIGAAISDAIRLRIPNWLTALIAVAFLPMALLTGMPLPVLGIHLAVGLGLFVLGFILFSFRLFGGGDAKLLAAAGLWIGYEHLLPFLVITAIAGGILALSMKVWSYISIELLMKENAKLQKLGAMKFDVPYGIALAAGALLIFPQSWWAAFSG